MLIFSLLLLSHVAAQVLFDMCEARLDHYGEGFNRTYQKLFDAVETVVLGSIALTWATYLVVTVYKAVI